MSSRIEEERGWGPEGVSTYSHRSRTDSGAPLTKSAAVEAEFSLTRTDMDLRSRENSKVRRRE